MIVGFALFMFGYALFYWGWHHMPGQKRYSLWALLGFGTIWKNLQMPAGAPVQFLPADSAGGSGSEPFVPVPNNNKTTSALKYPLGGSGFFMGRTDQGVDWSGKGPLYAIGAGTIVNVFNSGWPGGTFIVLKLDNPPAGLPSPDIYYAEDITPLVKKGQHVNAGDTIGTAYGGGSGIELGFADPNAIGRALAAGQFTGSNATALGQQFKAWIQSFYYSNQ